MAPVGALHERPPLAPVAQIERRVRRREHQRAGIEHVRQRAGIILRIGRDLREGLVAGRLDELLELPVRHRRAVDPEAVDRHAMARRFLRIMIVGAHAERAAGNPDHVRRSARHPIAFPPARHRLAATPWHPLRTCALLAVVPETLRARWVRVVPAHARSGSGTCPCGSRSGGYKADGSASGDGSAPGPIVPTRPGPSHAAAAVARPHHGAAPHDRPLVATPPRGPTAARPPPRAPARTSITSGLDWPMMACTANERVAPIFNADAGPDIAPVPSVAAQAKMPNSFGR